MNGKVIRKWFWAWNFEAEEKWLNQMAQKGWVLEDVGFCKFRFVSAEPGAYAVRMEMMEEMPNSEKGMDYIGFIEETGAEYIGSVMKWAYFRKKVEDGEFELFSDIDSRIRHLDRMMKSIGMVGAANLAIGMSNLRLNGLGLINIACAALLGYCVWRIKGKKDRLNAERVLHE